MCGGGTDGEEWPVRASEERKLVHNLHDGPDCDAIELESFTQGVAVKASRCCVENGDLRE